MTDNLNNSEKVKLCAVHKKTHKELHKRAYKGLEAYVECQKKVDSILVKSALGKGKYKKLDKYFNRMAIIDSYVAEVAKTYRIIFDSDMDIQKMTTLVVKKVYPQLYKAVEKRAGITGEDEFLKRMEEKGLNMKGAKIFDLDIDGDISKLPEEMREFGESVQKALRESGKDNVKMRFVDISSGIGVNFPSGPIPHNTKEFKEMMTETAIHNAEDAAASASEEPVETAGGKAARDSHRSGTTNPKKDKLN